MASVSKVEAISNFSWRYIGKIGSQIISFVVTIILARLLAPEAFGAVAIVCIFTSILQVFVDSGLGSGLVQMKDANDVDFSTVFYFNIFACIIIYVFLFLFAPLVSKFYNTPLLTSLLRVSSLSLIITGLRSTQETFVTRNLLFKKHFYATTIAVFLSSVIGILMAYEGFGVWSIVFQQLANTGISTVLLWLIVPWRPKFLFSYQRLKYLLSYGWKILGALLVDTIYSDIRSLLIGKVYSSQDLAFYDRGKQFPYMIVSGVNTALNSVLFPVLSRSQDNKPHFKNLVRKSIRASVFFISAVLAYVFCSAEAMVEVLMTEKWLPCVIYLQILCFDALFWSIITVHYNSFNAIGRSDLYLKFVFVTNVVGILLLIVAIPFGVIYVALSSVLAMVIQVVIVAIESRRQNLYAYGEQLKDIFKAMMPAFLIFIATWWVRWLTISPLFVFIIQSVLAGIIFIIYGKKTGNEGYMIVENIIKTKFFTLYKDR